MWYPWCIFQFHDAPVHPPSQPRTRPYLYRAPARLQPRVRPWSLIMEVMNIVQKNVYYIFSVYNRDHTHFSTAPPPSRQPCPRLSTTVPPPPPQPCPRPDNCTTTLTPPNRVSGPYLEYNLCTFCECDIDPSMFGVIGDCESIHPTTMTCIRTLVVTNLLLQRVLIDEKISNISPWQIRFIRICFIFHNNKKIRILSSTLNLIFFKK